MNLLSRSKLTTHKFDGQQLFLAQLKVMAFEATGGGAFDFWEIWMLNFLPTAFLLKVIIASTVDVFVYVKIVSATLYVRYLVRENYLDL